MKIKLAVIDDQRLFREGLIALLKNVPEFDVIAEHQSGTDFIGALKESKYMPDVALIDMNMPAMNGVELTEILQRDFPEIKIIILTVYNQDRFINKMIEAGVSGYLLKNCEAEEVIQAIRAISKTGFYFNEGVVNAMRNTTKHKSTDIRNLSKIPIELTEREEEILQLICKEYTNPEIAQQLFISARTVDGHRNNLLAKTGCKNTAGLVVFAITNGIFDILPG